MPSTQFSNLAREKREEILFAALVEFAEQGYDMASTNRIVQRAGISKGVLFKYFIDKENLFLNVLDHYIATIVESLGVPSEIDCQDLFDFIKGMSLKKIQFYKQQPVLYKFFVRIVKDTSHPVYARAMASMKSMSEEYMKWILRLIPSNQLREGVRPEQVLTIVTWVLEGLQNKYLEEIPQSVADETYDAYCEHLENEMEEYFDLLKLGLYRRGNRV